MDNYFSSPDLYNNLTKQKINCCGTVPPNHKGMPDDFRSKKLKLKWGDVRVRTSSDMTAVVWKDKHNVHMLTNMRDPPAEMVGGSSSSSSSSTTLITSRTTEMGHFDSSFESVLTVDSTTLDQKLNTILPWPYLCEHPSTVLG